MTYEEGKAWLEARGFIYVQKDDSWQSPNKTFEVYYEGGGYGDTDPWVAVDTENELGYSCDGESPEIALKALRESIETDIKPLMLVSHEIRSLLDH